jgi:hypothetical protein
MDERERIRLPADKTPEEWAQFFKRLFVRCLIVAVACGSVAAIEVAIMRSGGDFNPFFSPVFGLLILLLYILAFAAGVSAIVAFLGLHAWIGILLNIWLRKRR